MGLRYSRQVRLDGLLARHFAHVKAALDDTADLLRIFSIGARPGDVVIFSKYGGTEVKYNGEEFLILSARDVLAVVNK